ncbi:hypothetical protein RAS1_42400 [Phycisphaerae bacterium RAS1]|nr:hypothetical protein RAS1_42400 [Phycisphaerae bacterium RAS1]
MTGACRQFLVDSNDRYCIHCAYRLAGLPEPRCPECGTPFDVNDARTWSRAPGQLRSHAPLAASFAGAVVGGALSLGLGLLYEGYNSTYGHVTDHANRLFTATALNLASWFVVVVSFLVDRGRVLFRSMLAAALSGAMAAAVVLWTCFSLELCPAQLAHSTWHTMFAMMGGAITGGAARAAMRQSWVRSAAGPTFRVVVLLWFVGPMVVATWIVCAWPVICRLFPDLAYRVGSDETRLWAVRFALRNVEVGDSTEVIHRRLPGLFGTQPLSGEDKTWNFGQNGAIVHLRIEDGRVVELRY